jgi:hypothetical protein
MTSAFLHKVDNSLKKLQTLRTYFLEERTFTDFSQTGIILGFSRYHQSLWGRLLNKDGGWAGGAQRPVLRGIVPKKMHASRGAKTL